MSESKEKPASKQEKSASEAEKSAPKAEKSVSKAERKDARAKRQAERAEKRGEKATAGRPTKLCALSTVEVRKDEEGFQVIVNQSEGRGKFVVTPDQVGPVLRDLETAIQVIRNFQ
jgi:hypothetical protein